MKLSLDQKLNLLNMKFKILEMKADHYNWSCHVPQELKDQIEEVLIEINSELEGDKNE